MQYASAGGRSAHKVPQSIWMFGSTPGPHHRSALDIEGLGEETAALLVTEGLVSSLAELFDISPEQLVEYEGFAEKSAASLVEAIQSKKAPDLPQFLIALGIPEVGTAVARDLSGYFGSIAAILGATAEELEQIDGIGPKMSEVITAFLEDERNRSAIDAILARGVSYCFELALGFSTNALSRRIK